MSLDNKFLIITEPCNCDDERPVGQDGYTMARFSRCLECFGQGTVTKKVSLVELKALLDGYGGGS